MKPFEILFALLFIGMIAMTGCTSQEDSAVQNGHTTIVIKQLDVIMLGNESGGDCYIAGLYNIMNAGNSPVIDEKVSVELIDVEKGEKIGIANISVTDLSPGQSGNYTVRFDNLECVEKYTLRAPLQKDYYSK